jgi:hypothetical protein
MQHLATLVCRAIDELLRIKSPGELYFQIYTLNQSLQPK